MNRKPMLIVDELVEHSKEKGIRFNIMSEEEAKQYLDKNNNYFKLTSYRKNYFKATEKSDTENYGKYVGLDFAYLIELARIDVEVRHILLKMCLDIEHFLKVSLMKAVENNMISGNEDGYKIVNDYLTDEGNPDFKSKISNISKRSGPIANKIKRNKSNPYCAGLISKYSSDMPIWALLEIISFGDLVSIIEYYSKNTGWILPVDLKCLDRVRQIRNAAAHSNCIINDLRASSLPSHTPQFITSFVSAAGIKSDSRKKKLSNERINQIVHLLYAYDKIVKSENTRKRRLNELHDLINNRMFEHEDYFNENELLKSTHKFFVNLVNYISSIH